MKKVTPFIGVSAVALAAILFVTAPFCFAQEPGGGGGGQAPQQPPGGQPGGQPGGGGRQPGAQPNFPGQNQDQTQFPDVQQTPIYLSGKVRLSDGDRKSTRLNSSHVRISYAGFCLKKKNQ